MVNFKNLFGIFNRNERAKVAAVTMPNERKYIYYQNTEAPTAKKYTRNDVGLAFNYARRNGNYKDYLEISEAAMLDDHVATIFKTILFSLSSRKILVLEKKGKENDILTEKINKEWIEKVQYFFLKTKFFGFGCLELGNWDEENGSFTFCTDVSRFLIKPEIQGIYRSTAEEGVIIDLKSAENKNFIYIYNSQLGDLAPALLPFVSKKNAELAMDNFNGKQSGSFLVYTTDADLTNENTKRNISYSLSNFATSGSIMMPKSDKIEIISTPSDSVTANMASADYFMKAISKALMGQTMLFSDGSSLSQAKVHENQAELFLMAYLQSFENFLNSEFKKAASFCGLELTNYTLKISNIKPSLEEKLKVYDLLLKNFDIDEKIISSDFGVEVENKTFRQQDGI